MTKQKLYNIKPNLFINKDIALIGNSDNLLKNKAKEIDKFKTIIRFNFADPDKNKKYIGHKTTIRWIRCPIDFNSVRQHNTKIEKDNTNSYIKKLTSDANAKIIASNTTIIKLRKINPNGIYYEFDINKFNDFDSINRFLHTIGVENRFDNIKGCWIRTGFLAVITCIASNCMPHLFGFDLEKKDYIKHYGTNHVFRTDSITYHQINKEIDILNEMIIRGLIIVH